MILLDALPRNRRLICITYKNKIKTETKHRSIPNVDKQTMIHEKYFFCAIFHFVVLIDDELVRRRKDELRHAQEVRELYEMKLGRANNLFKELNNCMMQLEQRERELLRRERQIFNLLNGYGYRKRGQVKHRFMRPVWLRTAKNGDAFG